MNVVIEYPEDFPLEGVDRKVFNQRLRDFLNGPDDSAYELRCMRECLGLSTNYASSGYYELGALLKLVRTDDSQEVRDALFAKIGRYVNVQLKPAQFHAEPEQVPVPGHAPDATTRPRYRARRFLAVVGLSGLCMGIGLATGYEMSAWHSTRSNTVSRHADEPAGLAAPGAALRDNNIASIDPDVASIDPDVADVDLSWETNSPAIDIDAIRRILPQNGGDYAVSLKLTRILPEIHASASAKAARAGAFATRASPASGSR